MIKSSSGDAMTSPSSQREAEVLLDEPTRALCSAVASGRLTPARLAVVAPGGYGKTAVLERLARDCDRAGMPISRFGDHADAPLVFVDDAHQLTPSALAELRELAGDENRGLVIAARPWPRPDTLNGVLARLRGQVVLRPLDRARIAALLGRARAGLAEFVAAQTGGVPGFVTRLVHTLGTEPRLPASALVDFAPEIDRLPSDTLLLLLAAQAGADLDATLLGRLLDRDHRGVAETIAAARATGLLGHDGTLLPVASRALEALVPAERRVDVAQRLVRLQLERNGPVLGLVRPLLNSGRSGTEPASAFEAAADEAAPTDPALAARLFSAAVDAGRSVATVGARWAEAAARMGDLDTALRLTDQVIADPDSPDRAHGAQTAGTALVHRGQLARSAELYRWAGTRLSTVYAAVSLVGTGRKSEAEALLAEPSSGDPPTLLSGAMSSAARGVLETITADPATALSTLVNSAEMLEPVGNTLLVPDSPAALGALVAIHCGELSIARTLLDRALTTGSGGPSLTARHRLLLAWVAMVRGDTAEAAERLEAAGTSLAPRDWLFAVGLRAGLARRASDLAGLRTIWGDACEAVIRHRVDLFTLLPFGELVVAAARLGDRDRLSHQVRQAHDLLRALGEPPLWTTPLHWSGLHAAIMTEQPDEARDHVAALTETAEHSRYHSVIADAAECWCDVLSGVIDPARVEAAAKGLHGTGLAWDGARLAGQAAIRTTDRAAMVSLLDCARMLQGKSPAAATPEAVPALSERERQVAELVVAGMTYKQVGDRLFISAKTVEHHMARMRQRLGATSRSDLLARLRALVAEEQA